MPEIKVYIDYVQDTEWSKNGASHWGTGGYYTKEYRFAKKTASTGYYATYELDWIFVSGDYSGGNYDYNVPPAQYFYNGIILYNRAYTTILQNVPSKYRIAPDNTMTLWTTDDKIWIFQFKLLYIGLSYTLTFGNPGTGITGDIPGAITVQYGSSVQLPTNPFTKTGYTFRKWRITYSGGFTHEYDSGQTFTWNYAADMIVNASWTVNQYAITLNYKGKGTNTTENLDYNTFYTFNSPTSTGYTFGGWSATDGGVAVSYASFYVSVAKIFYAIWTANGINITFDRNGVGIGTTISKNYDSVFNVGDFPRLIAVGYTFDGWGNGVGSNDKLTDFSFTVSIARTFYARWVLNSNDKNFSFTELLRVYDKKGTDSISIGEYMPSIGKAANTQTAFIGDFKGRGRVL